ncbi:hypothetical protein jhhlp_005277 [Lomentospora prolificans]|uniref:Carboxylic ester hydrolase n=1 Tax=Lomentospora prolificans TaxID=41688 RepID=A0A2N3N7B3_9PEZI|nr:hypothetical protein jhhlp_005277 [Lomentospora prolificans]
MGLFKTVVSAIAGLSALAGVNAASLQQVASFGDNPSGARMYIYVPDKVASSPAIVVAIHYCTGTASAYYNGTPYARLADQHGFIVIYPESPYDGGCWDVSSNASLTRGGGGNSNAIANMVTYTLSKYNGDKSRVFATGTSSGAMMTNVLAATYPDMFAAASVYAGVPAGCFYTGTVNGWNNTCSSGQSIHTQAEWASTAFAMYPGYGASAPRPKMQIYHGDADTILYPQNWQETIKQWTGVFGYSTTATNTETGLFGGAWTRYTYGPKVQGIFGAGITHNLPIQGDEDMKWFGITGGSSSSSTTLVTSTKTASSSTSTTKAPATTTTAATGGQARWGQCAGIGWSGPTAVMEIRSPVYGDMVDVVVLVDRPGAVVKFT